MKWEKRENIRLHELSGGQQTMLDGFRVVAALFVLVGHSFAYYRLTPFQNEAYFPFLQNIGVVMFFLLSGFLTVFSLERKNREHGYSFSRFVMHKSKRMAYEYLPGLLLIALIDAVSIAVNADRYAYADAYTFKQFAANALMLQNMGPEGVLGVVFVPFGSGRPLWTLSVEWWLYILFGALYLAISNRERISLPKSLLFAAILAMSSHYLITGRGSGLGFVFALGVLGYYVYDLLAPTAARVVFPLSCAMYVIYGLLAKSAYTVYSFLLLWLVFISALQLTRNARSKRDPLLAFVSKSTFMLYLIHYSIIDLIYCAELSWTPFVKFSLGIVLSLCLSFVAYEVFGEKKLIEKALSAITRKTDQ